MSKRVYDFRRSLGIGCLKLLSRGREVEASRELTSCSRTSLVLAFPLTTIHFGVTLTANNFTSEASEDPICPLFISKET